MKDKLKPNIITNKERRPVTEMEFENVIPGPESFFTHIVKKTDLEKFQELYSSLGIELVVVPDKGDQGEDIQRVNLVATMGHSPKEETRNEKFDGYSGFYSTIDFDTSGKFVKQGFWE